MLSRAESILVVVQAGKDVFPFFQDGGLSLRAVVNKTRHRRLFMDKGTMMAVLRHEGTVSCKSEVLNMSVITSAS